MKKTKVLLSVAVAVILIMALSVTAFAAAPAISMPATADKGDTITVTVSTQDKGLTATIATSGLEFVEGPRDGKQVAIFPDLGASSAEYTYKVIAEQGEGYSFSLENVGVSLEGNVPDESVAGKTFTANGTVNAAPQPVDPSQPADPDQPADPSQPADPDAPVQGGDTQDKENLDDVPKTGDASQDMWIYAVMALAAAGVIGAVAFKKAFSK